MKKTEVECCDITCIHDDKVRTVRQRMPEEERLKELADFYKVFADATRIKILWILRNQRCASATWQRFWG